MGLGSRLLAGTVVVGLGVGVAVLVANGPRILRAARPIVRQGLKRGLEVYALVRGAAAELADDVEDLIAEVQAELKQARAPAPGADASDGSPEAGPEALRAGQ